MTTVFAVIHREDDPSDAINNAFTQACQNLTAAGMAMMCCPSPVTYRRWLMAVEGFESCRLRMIYARVS